MKNAEKNKDQAALHQWYLKNKRDLPWRMSRDPYRIWISEVMLQQTTVTAVIPFYEKFMTRFPTLKSLAGASEQDVLQYWAGLGYYSRARNLLKAAKVLHSEYQEFPKDYAVLLQLPGFGPYTSRAVASLAHDQSVGVLDGNVIRVLSRRFGLPIEHWKPKGRDELQERADKMVQNFPSGDMNQALMELGATICTPQSPTCMLCPWLGSCEARKANNVDTLPLKKPRRAHEIWNWSPHIFWKKKKIALVQNDYAPFLRGQWLLPGEAKMSQGKKPKKFDFKHGITHHDIFVKLETKPKKSMLPKNAKWVTPNEAMTLNPTSLLKKALYVAVKKTEEKKK